MSSDLSQIKADKTVDARGVSCPGPLLAAKTEIGKIPKDGVMEVLSADEGTKHDLPRWCKKIGHEYLGCLEESGYFRIFIRKKR